MNPSPGQTSQASPRFDALSLRFCEVSLFLGPARSRFRSGTLRVPSILAGFVFLGAAVATRTRVEVTHRSFVSGPCCSVDRTAHMSVLLTHPDHGPWFLQFWTPIITVVLLCVSRKLARDSVQHCASVSCKAAFSFCWPQGARTGNSHTLSLFQGRRTVQLKCSTGAPRSRGLDDTQLSPAVEITSKVWAHLPNRVRACQMPLAVARCRVLPSLRSFGDVKATVARSRRSSQAFGHTIGEPGSGWGRFRLSRALAVFDHI